MLTIYTTLTARVAYAQGRRIRCDRCGECFTYLHQGETSATALGLPLISTNRHMASAALRRALRRIRRLTRSPRRGEARCPHCHTYSRWMVARSRRRRIGLGIAVGGAVALVAEWMLALFDAIGADLHSPALAGAAATAGALVGALTGWCLALDARPRTAVRRPATLSDRQLADLLAQSGRAGIDPVAGWRAALDIQLPPGAYPIGLGFYDDTGEMDFAQHASKAAYERACASADQGPPGQGE